MLTEIQQATKTRMMNKALGNKFVMALIDGNDPRRAAIRFRGQTGYPHVNACLAVNAVLESRGLPIVTDWTTFEKAPKGFKGSSEAEFKARAIDNYIGGGINF